MKSLRRSIMFCALGAAAVTLYACSEDRLNPTSPIPVTAQKPLADIGIAGNGTGACMGDDAFAFGATSGLGSASGLNCTANDIAIASATVTEYSLVSASGPFTPLTPGSTITCNQGSTIYARTNAILQNSAQTRWDIGIWIATDGGNATTGTCNHYNLINGAAGVLNDDNDSCGDMSQGGLTTVPLDVLTLTCTPAPGSDSLLVGACLGWKNSIGTNGANICPAPGVSGGLGFRDGTVPETKSKCNCDGFKLPITVLQTAKLEVAKVCSPTSDTGTFDLLIDGSNTFGDNKSCGQSTGAQTVTAGTNANPGADHTFGEGDFTAANYTTSYSCVNRVGGASRGTGTSLGPNTITLQPNDDVVCTYTNTRKPSLTVNKVCAPTNDAGKFNLQIDAATAGTGADAACGGTTGAIISTIGSHSVGETAGTSTSLSDYTTVIGGDCAANGSVTLAAGQNKVCTITNTRKPKLTVNKVCSPTSDAGAFNLQIDASTAGTGANAACGGTTGAVVSTIGSHTVGETAGTATSLTDYISVIGGDCASNGSVTLAAGDNKVCTITNTRKATLTVNKVCSPTNDAGAFNLQIDASTAGTGANAACGGTTGAVVVTAATHTVAETAGTSTSLTDYTSVIGGDCASNGSVTLSPGDHKVCTITNTRKPRLTVTKICAPTSDAGKFNLQIDAATAGTGANAACGGTTGTVTTTIGSHSVGETAGTATSLTDYTSVIGGDCASDGSITLAAGDNKSCTITNTRKPRLTVNKVCVPTNDGGKFNLQIDAATAGTGANAACGGTTGTITSTIGSHTVGETAGTSTALTDYVTVISGACASDGSVTLAAGDNKTCTITNSRLPNLTIKKVVIGAGATFGFTGTGTGVSASFSLSPASDNFATTVFSSIPIGTKTITETLLSNYVLTDLTCDDAATIYDPLVTQTVSTTLAYGSNVTCTFTNEIHVGATTRTQGFWATHSSITNVAWFGGTDGINTFAGVADHTFCTPTTKDLNTLGRVLGGFWSNIAKTTTGGKRASIDQSRMQLMQQLLAAMLNQSAFGSSPTTVTIAQAKAAYCGTDETAIKNAASAMAAFNTSGDSGAFTPGASANGKVAKDLATLPYWDILP